MRFFLFVSLTLVLPNLYLAARIVRPASARRTRAGETPSKTISSRAHVTFAMVRPTATRSARRRARSSSGSSGMGGVYRGAFVMRFNAEGRGEGAGLAPAVWLERLALR